MSGSIRLAHVVCVSAAALSVSAACPAAAAEWRRQLGQFRPPLSRALSTLAWFWSGERAPAQTQSIIVSTWLPFTLLAARNTCSARGQMIYCPAREPASERARAPPASRPAGQPDPAEPFARKPTSAHVNPLMFSAEASATRERDAGRPSERASAKPPVYSLCKFRNYSMCFIVPMLPFEKHVVVVAAMLLLLEN